MRTSYLTVFFSFFLIQLISSQQIWNVNNVTTGVQTDFTTLQEAVDSASAGDTIYVYPSATAYGGVTIDKKLIIIGSGYNIPDNADSTGVQTYFAAAKVGAVTFQGDAGGSTVTGLDISGNVTVDSVTNILIQRNKMAGRLDLETGSFNIIIEGNYFHGMASGVKLAIGAGCATIAARNNIFDSFVMGPSFKSVDVNVASSADFQHNVFRDVVLSVNCSYRNNIFLNDNLPSIDDNVLEHNVFTNDSTDIPPSNVIGANPDSIFVGFPTQGDFSLDGKYHLQSNSPAKGAGEGGIDAGAFGGVTPYKLSGLPFVPIIYEIDAPTTGTSSSGLPITIKARAEN